MTYAVRLALWFIVLTLGLLATGCQNTPSSTMLSIRVSSFGIERSIDTLQYPVLYGSIEQEKIIRDVDEAEYIYQKLKSTTGFNKFSYLSTFTLDTIIADPEVKFKPWIVYRTKKDSAHIEILLESIENGEPKFRITRTSDDTIVYSFTLKPGRSDAVGFMDGKNQEKWTTLNVACWILKVEDTGNYAPILQFLAAKNRQRGSGDSSAPVFFEADQALLDRHFGKGRIAIPVRSDSLSEPEIDRRFPIYPHNDSLDSIPMPIGGLAILKERMKYPESARRDTLTGTVILSFLIDTTGEIRAKKIVRSVRGDLDTAALSMLDSVFFTPPTVRGAKVNIWLNLPVRFALK